VAESTWRRRPRHPSPGSSRSSLDPRQWSGSRHSARGGVAGERRRTALSRVGPIRIWRQLYRAPQGRPRFPRDESWGLAARVPMTAGLERLTLERCRSGRSGSPQGRVPTDSLLGPVTRHRWLGRVGDAGREEDERVRAQGFEAGGRRRVARWLIKADGRWVHRQRTPGKEHLEVELVFANEGWEKEGVGRRQQVCISTVKGLQLLLNKLS
jgi:hypothetical protein